MARGHLAWPLFLAVGIATAGALLHIAWALGASWGAAHAIPEDPKTAALHLAGSPL